MSILDYNLVRREEKVYSRLEKLQYGLLITNIILMLIALANFSVCIWIRYLILSMWIKWILLTPLIWGLISTSGSGFWRSGGGATGTSPTWWWWPWSSTPPTTPSPRTAPTPRTGSCCSFQWDCGMQSRCEGVWVVSCFCCQLPHLDHHAGRPGAGLHLRGGGEQAAHRGARHRVPGPHQQVPPARAIVSTS